MIGGAAAGGGGAGREPGRRALLGGLRAGGRLVPGQLSDESHASWAVEEALGLPPGGSAWPAWPASSGAESGRRAVGGSLGAGHQFTELEVTTAVLLARSLGMPAGGEARWLARGLPAAGGAASPRWRAGGSGRAGSAGCSRCRGWCGCCCWPPVFDEVSFGQDRLGDLRRLADLVRVARGGRRR